MSKKITYFFERCARGLGSFLLAFALLTTAVFAFSFWDSGKAPEAAPGDGNVKLSVGSSSGGIDVECPVGSSLRVIKSDGTVACETDDIGSSSGGVDTIKACAAGKAMNSFNLSNDTAPTCISVGGGSSSGGLSDISIESCDPGYSIRKIDFTLSGDTASGAVVCEEDNVGGGSVNGDDLDATKSCGEGYAIKGFDLIDDGEPTCVAVGSGGDSFWKQDVNGGHIYYGNSKYGVTTARVGIKGLANINGIEVGGYQVQSSGGSATIGATNEVAGASFRIRNGKSIFNIWTEDGAAHFRTYKNENFVFDNVGGDQTKGRVGIGTASPIEKLQVIGNIRAEQNLGAQAFYDINDLNYKVDPNAESKLNEATFTAITLGGVRRTTWPEGGSGGTSLWTRSGSNIYYNDGNVGIGTANPRVKLEINGSMSAGVFYDTDNSSGTSFIDPTATSKVNSIVATGTICDKNGCIGGGGGSAGIPCDWNGWAIRQSDNMGAACPGTWVVGESSCCGSYTCAEGTKVNFYCQGGVITNSGIVKYCRGCSATAGGA